MRVIQYKYCIISTIFVFNNPPIILDTNKEHNKNINDEIYDITPVFYLYMERFKEWVKRVFKKHPKGEKV